MRLSTVFPLTSLNLSLLALSSIYSLTSPFELFVNLLLVCKDLAMYSAAVRLIVLLKEYTYLLLLKVLGAF